MSNIYRQFLSNIVDKSDWIWGIDSSSCWLLDSIIITALKCDNFYIGEVAAEKQPISCVTTIYLTPRLTSPSCRVDCGMLFLDICVSILLAGTETRCCKHRSRASQTSSVGEIPGEAAAHARTIGHTLSSPNLFALKMPPNAPVLVFYNISLPTMGHWIQNYISTPLTHTVAYMLTAICPLQGKPGSIHGGNSSPNSRTPWM